MAIGAAAGGIGIFAFVLITGYGTTEGWEGLIAIVSGMIGAFCGAVIGLVGGAAVGLYVDSKDQTDRHRP